MTSEYSTELSTLFAGPQAQQALPTRTINVKRMLRMRMKSMLLVFVVVLIPAVPLAWLSVPIRYTATAQIECAATRPIIIEEVGSTGNYGLFMQTQRQKIAGPSIMSKVAEDPSILALEWLRNQPDPMYYLLSNITVSNKGGTELLTVEFSAPNPADAKTVVATVCNVYLRTFASSEESEGTDRLTRLGELKRDLTEQIIREQNLIKTMRDAIDSPYAYNDPVSETPEMVSLLAASAKTDDDRAREQGIIRQKEELIAQIQEIQKAYAASPTTEVLTLNIEDAVRRDTRVTQMRQSLSLAELEVTKQSDIYQGDQPQLVAAERSRNSIQSELEKATIEARGDALESSLALAQQELAGSQSLLKSFELQSEALAKEIVDQRKKDSELNQRLGSVQAKLKVVEQLEKTLDRVEQKIDQIEVERDAPARVRLASEASAPTTPDRDKQYQMVILAIAASLCAGLGFGALREFMDQDIRSSQDMAYITKLPVLAAVPHASVDRIPASAPVALLAAEYPESTTADEYRRILTRIIYPPEGAGEINTCLIVSPSRGDGKTSLATNLAISLAQANRRVLLVDISSRHPSIERCFDLEPDDGLSEILVDNVDPSSVYRETEFPNLYVLGPGHHGRELVGKLASREIGEFFEAAESQFEHVIIDTPPSLYMSDAKLLAPIVDGVIVVIGAGVTKIGMIRRCLQDMALIGANVVGLVINGVRPYRGGYLDRNLSMYYSYSEGRQERRGKGPHVTDAKFKEEETPMMMLLDEGLPAPDSQDADVEQDETPGRRGL